MAFTEHARNGISWLESDVIPLRHMFTRRLGGVGDFPYSSHYDPVWLLPERQARVRAQWLALLDAGGFPPEGICFTHQVHGRSLRYVTEADRRVPPLAQVPQDCDGLVTDRPGVPLAVFTADCVPVLLCDGTAGAAAAVHCGWKGTVLDMAGAAVEALTALGARPERLRAAIGPAISQCCFETGPEVPEGIRALLGGDAAGLCPPEAGVPGKFLVDLKEANRRRLLQLGLAPDHIDVSADCTMCMRDAYWSHRATKGVRGTQASVIML